MLLISSALLERLNQFDENEKRGGKKVLKAYLELVREEIKFAENQTESKYMKDAAGELSKAIEGLEEEKYDRVRESISRCTSKSTTLSSRSLDYLKAALFRKIDFINLEKVTDEEK